MSTLVRFSWQLVTVIGLAGLLGTVGESASYAQPLAPEIGNATTAATLPRQPVRMAQFSARGATRGSDIRPTAETLGKAANLIADVVEPELVLTVRPNRSKILRTKKPVTRTSVSDPVFVEVTQLSPTEFEVIGLRHGETSVTFWFGEVGEQQEILRYLIVIAPDESIWDDITKGYSELEQMINEMYPQSSVQLIPVADKLIVRGEARDIEEASQIMQIARGQYVNSQTSAGSAQANASPNGVSGLPGSADSLAGSGRGNSRVVNLLRVPHEHQILLKVRVAELSRTAIRELGVDFSVQGDNFFLNSVLGGGANLTAILDGGDVNLFLRAIASNGNSKILAEPNLVTLNGQTASFIAGGQFAVPTAVGVNGIGAATTTFQGFGTQLLFTPTVMDKDMIRLQVVPTFSSLNTENMVNGIPGLNTRSVSTMVDMRAGQWLAIAGLLQDEQQGASSRIPGLGDIPFAGVLFSRKRLQRNETELIVLVSPEFVHPLELEQLPLMLPGMEVTEPGPVEFYAYGMIEGAPEEHHRSTVYHQTRSLAYREAIRSAKSNSRYQRCEKFYVSGAHGFSE